MYKSIKIFLFIFFSLIAFIGFCQTTNSQLAAHYYQNKEYDKALIYYKRLYTDKKSTSNYTYLFKSYLKLEDYLSAQKLAKQYQRINTTYQKSKVDYGYALGLEGKYKSEEKEYKKLIKTLTPNYSLIVKLANAFEEIDKKNQALAVYERGRVLLKNNQPLNLEIAELYFDLEQFDDMTEELLNLLELNPGYLKTVEAMLNKNLANEANSHTNEALKKGLIQKINQRATSTVFPEMLIWVYMQESNWSATLVQVKALDKRLKEEGARVYTLGEMLLNNQEYEIAKKAYQYVIELGEASPYFIESTIGSLLAQYHQITENGNIEPLKISNLLNDFDKSIELFGKNGSTSDLLRQKAYIQCFYEHKLENGLDTYEELISINGLSVNQLAEIKIEYADALLSGGYIWDASLIYNQVDKDFKYDYLGETAKFKNSKIHFYTGNFNLAKAQLDILKGATTKLIANDAMLLSVIITDNSTVDTSTVPLKLYADADLLIFQNKFDSAQLKLDTINNKFPGHSLEDEILFLRYQMALKVQEFDAAAGFLKDIKDQYSEDILADKAIFYLAELYEQKLNSRQEAKILYQLIITDYPDSLFATESRKRFRKMRGDQL